MWLTRKRPNPNLPRSCTTRGRQYSTSMPQQDNSRAQIPPESTNDANDAHRHRKNDNKTLSIQGGMCSMVASQHGYLLLLAGGTAVAEFQR